MAAMIGAIGEFDPAQEQWTQYRERLSHFFTANGIVEAEKKKAVLLTVMGRTAYKLLRNLLTPNTLEEMSLARIDEVMESHHCPKPSETVKRFEFYNRAQKQGETVSSFVAELRAIAEHCNFGDSLDQMLRDRLICGTSSEHMQRRLLSEADFTFKKALELAQGLKAAAKNAHTLKSTSAGPTQAEVFQNVSSQDERGERTCFRCGKKTHTAVTCRFKTAKCHKCGKTGHLKAVCRSRGVSTAPRENRQRAEQTDIRLVEETERATEEYTLNQLHTAGCSPLMVDVEVQGYTLPMEVDTGASLSLVSEDTFKRCWPSKRLRPTRIQLRTYTGEPLMVRGEMRAHVKHGQHTSEFFLLVVKGNGPSLLGRDWLEHLKLDWTLIHHVQASSLDTVLSKHAQVFGDGLGTLKDHHVSIVVDPAVPPRYCKARSVPYSMKTLVEEELVRLEREGVIEPVQYAEWAAPIVPVLKADKKSVRICGDFKLTVNRASKLDRYPIPRIEDLFAQISGGQVFSQLDLSQAYQQLPLDQASKKYVVISTQKGLFRYNRLPFGVSSAPGIFQRTMENLLQGIPHVVVYLDDILIAGPTPDEHVKIFKKE